MKITARRRTIHASRMIIPALMMAVLRMTSAHAADAKPGPSDIKLTFIGTGAPRPSEQRYGASIMVEAGGHRFLVDAGPGARERIFQAGGFAALTGIDTIFATHLHYDHIADIDDVWIVGWMYGRKVPLHVYGPAGMSNTVDGLRKAFGWDIRYREIVGIPPAGDQIIATDVRPGVIYDKDGIKFTAFDVAHMPIDPRTGKVGDLGGQTLGFRLDYKGHSVVFSGDQRDLPGSDLEKIGKGADVVIHEVQVPSPGNTPEATRANVSLTVHSSPEQAGHAFTVTRPRLAVYSHIIPPQTTGADLEKLTRPFYAGPLLTAEDLMTITIGNTITVGKASFTDAGFEASGAVKKTGGTK